MSTVSVYFVYCLYCVYCVCVYCVHCVQYVYCFCVYYVHCVSCVYCDCVYFVYCVYWVHCVCLLCLLCILCLPCLSIVSTVYIVFTVSLVYCVYRVHCLLRLLCLLPIVSTESTVYCVCRLSIVSTVYCVYCLLFRLSIVLLCLLSIVSTESTVYFVCVFYLLCLLSIVSTVLLCLLFYCVYCLLFLLSIVLLCLLFYCVYCLLCLCLFFYCVYCLLCLPCLLFYSVYCLFYLLCLLFYYVYCLLCILCLLCLTYPICSYRHLHQNCQQSWTPASYIQKLWLTDRQIDNSIFHPPPHIAIVQLFRLNKMSPDPPAVSCTSSTKPFSGITTLIGMSQYCRELWVSRKGNEPATNATSTRYYIILLRDVVKCLRTLTVANGSRKWMLRWYDTSICQLCRWWLISMSVCSILVLYLHCVLTALTENQFRAVLPVVSKGFYKLYIKRHQAANKISRQDIHFAPIRYQTLK